MPEIRNRSPPVPTIHDSLGAFCSRNGRFPLNTAQHGDLYEEHILDHYESPYHKGRLEGATYCQKGRNPLCGDQVQIQLAVDEKGRIEQAYFDGDGCAISQAAASILCEAVEGKRIDEVEAMQAQDMLDMLKVPLTATRQRCGLLGFKVLKTIVYTIADDRRKSD